jgi:transposase
VLMWTPSVKIYISTTPVDLRKSFNGLAGATRSILDSDPMSGHLSVFFNKRADLVKVLWWSNGGWSIYARRLERGTFRFLKAIDGDTNRIEVNSTELAMILDGIDLKATKRRKRWNPPVRAAAG